METSKNLVNLKEAIVKGAGKINGRNVYPVFNSITLVNGVFYGDLLEYSDAFGFRYSLEQLSLTADHEA